jgi:membrane protein
VVLGSVVTAVLFTVGKRLIGLYLGQASPASAYGAAGSVVIVMVWVFYSAQVVLLGAAITRVASEARGARPQPTPIAEPNHA